MSNLSADFSKNTQIPNIMTIRPVGTELFHTNGRTDGQTDRQIERNDEAKSRFSQFFEST
jgi:hypothetical protein